jgi:transposase InsO family protein
MQAEGVYSTRELCVALGVSRAGFYGHLQKPSRPRRQQDQRLTGQIREAFLASRQTYGTPRLQVDLATQGARHGRRRIARLMRDQALRPRQKRRFVPRTTDSSQTRRPAPPRLLDASAPTACGQIWTSDITYIPTREGFLYLAAELDLYSRRIVGWATAPSMETSLVLRALNRAVASAPSLSPDLLHHSDQGSQYASREFTNALAQLRFAQSMSRRGNCYDNAAMESFWATLKTECFAEGLPPTRAAATAMIFDYIETFYNPVRRHSSLGFLSPLQFEIQSTNN